jgi:CheY-like chemotaxis protein
MRPKALVVEDDVTTRRILRTLVESQGCDVDEAKDGEAALVLLDTNGYAVILLDIVLPKMSGTDVMDHLFKTNPAMLERIIVVTGLNIAEIRKVFPTVCNALPKPVIPKRLIESMRKCMREQGNDEHLTAL